MPKLNERHLPAQCGGERTGVGAEPDGVKLVSGHPRPSEPIDEGVYVDDAHIIDVAALGQDVPSHMAANRIGSTALTRRPKFPGILTTTHIRRLVGRCVGEDPPALVA